VLLLLLLLAAPKEEFVRLSQTAPFSCDQITFTTKLVVREKDPMIPAKRRSSMMAVAQSHVPTCRVRNIQESYRYDDMELGMDQTDASKKGNMTFEHVGFQIFPFILHLFLIIIFNFNNNNNNPVSE